MAGYDSRGSRSEKKELKQRIAGGLAVALALLVAAVGFWIVYSPSSGGAGPLRGAALHTPPQAALSTISIPLTIAHEDLTTSLEEKIPEVLVDKQGEEIREGWLADIKAIRPTPPVARGADGKLIVEVPIEVGVKVYRAKRAERRAAKEKDAPQGLGVSFSAVLEVSMDLDISDDWQLEAESEISHRWIEPPKLDVGPFKFNITKLVDKALAKKFEEIAQVVDERVREQDQLRLSIEKAWAKLGAQRQVNADPPTWITSEPEAIFASDLDVTEDTLQLTVGVSSRFTTVVGDPGAAPAARPLPPNSEPPERDGLNISVPVYLSWESLSAAANDKLADQSWELSGGTLTVTGVELYPSGNAVVVALSYRAETAWSTDGVLYLMGTPVIDNKARRVEVADFDYVLDTWDVAIAGTNALMESGIEEAVRSRLGYDFGPELDAARATANAQLSERDTEKGTLRCKLESIQIRGLYLTDEALVVDTRAKGTASLSVTELRKSN